jgi:hypothetical protein
MPGDGHDLTEPMAALPPEGRRALAVQWVRRALGAHVPDALEAGGFPALADDLRHANASDVGRLIRIARQTERAIDHQLSTTSSANVSARRAFDALSEALTGAHCLEQPTVSAAALVSCAEHARQVEALVIANLCGRSASSRIVYARERDRQAADIRRLVTA